MTSPVDLTLVAEHQRGHGAMYEALNRGSVDVPRLRQVLAGLPLPRAAAKGVCLQFGWRGASGQPRERISIVVGAVGDGFGEHTHASSKASSKRSYASFGRRAASHGRESAVRGG